MLKEEKKTAVRLIGCPNKHDLLSQKIGVFNIILAWKIGYVNNFFVQQLISWTNIDLMECGTTGLSDN